MTEPVTAVTVTDRLGLRLARVGLRIIRVASRALSEAVISLRHSESAFLVPCWLTAGQSAARVSLNLELAGCLCGPTWIPITVTVDSVTRSRCRRIGRGARRVGGSRPGPEGRGGCAGAAAAAGAAATVVIRRQPPAPAAGARERHAGPGPARAVSDAGRRRRVAARRARELAPRRRRGRAAARGRGAAASEKCGPGPAAAVGSDGAEA